MYHPPRKIDAVGEKRANYFAQIMFKHSLDIEAAFSGNRARNPLPSVLARMTNSIENCLGVKLITGLENKIIETEWLHHTLHTIKRLLSIEFKYIDLFKDSFVTIYIMMLTGGLNAVLTYPTSFTSVVVMVMATSIILPSLLSSLHLIICNPEIIYGFMGRTTANLWQKILVFSIVLLLSVFNPIFFRYDCHRLEKGFLGLSLPNYKKHDWMIVIYILGWLK